MAFNIRFYAYAIIGHTWADELLPQLLMKQFDTFPIQCRHIEHMHEGLWADQLLPQLIMEQFDTLQIQCRHIEHMHEEVYNFCFHSFY